MKLLRRPKSRAESEPVLPLVNVVFLLLIFFLISGVLAESSPFPVDPPAAAEKAEEEGAERLRLYMSAEGALALGREPLPRKELFARLAEKKEKAPLDLVADGKAGAQDVVALMRALREAGHSEIRLITAGEAG